MKTSEHTSVVHSMSALYNIHYGLDTATNGCPLKQYWG